MPGVGRILIKAKPRKIWVCRDWNVESPGWNREYNLPEGTNFYDRGSTNNI